MLVNILRDLPTFYNLIFTKMLPRRHYYHLHLMDEETNIVMSGNGLEITWILSGGIKTGPVLASPQCYILVYTVPPIRQNCGSKYK